MKMATMQSGIRKYMGIAAPPKVRSRRTSIVETLGAVKPIYIYIYNRLKSQ